MPKIKRGTPPNKPKQQQRFASFDPGDKHVGVALFDQGECIYCEEHSPGSSLRWLLAQLHEGLDQVVIERFQLYPNKASAQHGSDMLTSQLIGGYRVLCWLFDTPHVQQQAALKAPAESLIKRRGIRRLSDGEGGHAKDAESHGYIYLWKDQ